MASVLIIGCGAIGTGLAMALGAQGHVVTGLKRQPPETPSLIQYIKADITSTESINALDLAVDVVFFIVSADGRTESSYRSVYVDGLQNALAKFPKQAWFFVSSTRVYGQSQGEWVDEDSATEPEAITSQLICQAEQRVVATNPNHVVVRFSGIYGPGRDYLLRTARQSPAIQQTPPYFTNRIHQQDCIGVLVFLLQKRLAGAPLAACYLASDDDPAPLWEVVSWLAAQMACGPPVAKTIDGLADGNKRCRNQRLKALGYQFRYPSYRAGYAGLVK
ncbi:MAG: NAD-dependent epimerase/dehydratase family protein [Methylovulum sp.]|uniref:NAD-dependent epimerase/dehydratase family protein n=1 Tax=Methylovulum sp. TaxID=1916980 RepID=UPI002608E9C7|nr:NAD-dependent epimerase/dehydratase family protein [Methylovulum sp.]MDD2724911.1 NAD-dependent epimerase/dehydratase family protein [Methylovulum sp.]